MIPKIKICGLRFAEEADYLNEVKVDYAGFVFYEKSKRNINIDTAKEIFKRLDSNIQKVAVTVSPTKELVESINDAGFDVLQVHKELTAEVLETAKTKVWYAVNIEDDADFDKKQSFIETLPEELKCKIEAILVDAPSFGSGKPFNWEKSKRLKKAGAQSPPLFEGRDLILAGGLRPENVSEGINIFNPDVVDVSSSVEGENGKDREKILSFVNAVRNTVI